MIIRNTYLVTLILCVIIEGCSVNTREFSQETLMRSQLYKEKGLYEDLKWLADNYLHVGMDREDVEIILGSDNEPNVGNPKYEALYSSMREVPRGDYLSITLKDNKVETWGWIDE